MKNIFSIQENLKKIKGLKIAFFACLFLLICMPFFVFQKELITSFLTQTGAYHFLKNSAGIQSLFMIILMLGLMYLAICKKFEPLLLVPIAFGGILANIPSLEIAREGGFLYFIYEFGIKTGIFPLLIFIGVGAMTDFTPMLSNPKLILLGAAAQFAIFGTFLGAMALGGAGGSLFSLKEAVSISIIGGADGPTSIFLSGKLAPHLLGAISVAAYSYMALVPVLQPPVMRLLTTKKERLIRMKNQREVPKKELLLFPFVCFLLCVFFVPSAAPLIGMLMFGNILKECGVTERLSKSVQNELMNVTTLLLGLSIGVKLTATEFLQPQTLLILFLGAFAFVLGTASGVLMAKFMNLFLKDKINPLIGSAGVSAVPMAARVSQNLALKEDEGNFLLMHAMAPNVAGAIGSAVAAGVFLSFLG